MSVESTPRLSTKRHLYSAGSEGVPSHRRQQSAGSNGSFTGVGVPNIANMLVQTPVGSAHTSRRPSVDHTQREKATGGVAELGWGSEEAVHGCTPIFTEQVGGCSVLCGCTVAKGGADQKLGVLAVRWCGSVGKLYRHDAWAEFYPVCLVFTSFGNLES